MRSNPTNLDWPLMKDNITREDLDAVIDFLKQDDPRLTQGDQVAAFEREWSDWLGIGHSVFVNSGSSANLLSMAALKELRGDGEVVVPAITWVSDIASVIQCGLTPVVVDVNPRTLGMDTKKVLRSLTKKTKAVFLTHVLGYNALNDVLLEELSGRGVTLMEDVCESYGATFRGRKLGGFGWLSNFSFYFGHHLSTIEGGMISSDDREVIDMVRMMRSHGMVRDAGSPDLMSRYCRDNPDLSPDFIFAFPGYNMRSSEINAVIGRSQLKRLDSRNLIRSENLRLFLDLLDPDRYRTDFETEGSCNYAFTLVLRAPDDRLRDRIESTLRECRVEFRRGTSGGGNQLRQPYLKKSLGPQDLSDYPEVEHIHFYGFYIGNYSCLERSKIERLCNILNTL